MSHSSGHVIVLPPPKRVAEGAGSIDSVDISVTYPHDPVEAGKMTKRILKKADRIFAMLDEPDDSES